MKSHKTIVASLFFLGVMVFCLGAASKEPTILSLDNRTQTLERQVKSLQRRVAELEQLKRLSRPSRLKPPPPLSLMYEKLEMHEEIIHLLLLPPELRDAKPLKEPLRTGQHIYFTDKDRLKVRQVLDISNMLVEISSWPERPNIWVTGISTADLADNDPFSVDRQRVFEILGTKSYTTIHGGSKTLFHLKVVH